MNYHREFEIAWQGLKTGLHEYQYHVDDQVLAHFGYEPADFEGLEVEVGLKFEKENNFFLLQFDVHGKADVTCDRCGDTFPLALWDEHKMVIKLTDTEEKAAALNKTEDGSVVYIPRSETVINIFEWVYEFIMLSFPIQRVHPNREDGTSGCNPEALKLLKEMSRPEHPEQAIWKDLEQFRNHSSDN